MVAQLRRYRIRSGQGEVFADEWACGVAPLRERFGFRVQGWLVDGTDDFVWILEHDDEQAFAEADSAYYASSDRESLDPDPARLILETSKDWVTRYH